MAAVDIPAPHRHGDGERCPWCDQPVPREKFDEISGRIAARERQRHADVTARLREEMEREMAAAAAAATVEADTAHAGKLAEMDGARQAAEQKLAEVQAAQEVALAQRLGEQREAFEAAKTAEITAVRLQAVADKLKFETQLKDLQRKLENKTAEELGEGAEADLYEELKQAFADDRISRVEKGAAGPDIVHDIYYNGRLCGRIVYDAKNRNAWRNEYVGKLRQDQIDCKADHAILASRVFPAGAREIHLQDGVIVAHPSRTLILAQLLRRHVLQTHALRMSNDARTQKKEELYAFMTSDRCAQFLGSVAAQAKAMADMDEKERRAHEATWRKRDDLVRALQRVHGQLTSEVERILGTGL